MQQPLGHGSIQVTSGSKVEPVDTNLMSHVAVHNYMYFNWTFVVWNCVQMYADVIMHSWYLFQRLWPRSISRNQHQSYWYVVGRCSMSFSDGQGTYVTIL